MKKPAIAIILAVFLILFCGCAHNDRDTAKPDEPDKVQLSSQDSDTTAEPEDCPVMPQSNVYRNISCGYSFEFPASWQGYYFVNDDNPQAVTVRFYGKSFAGTAYEKETFGGDWGLTIFFILSREEAQTGFYDNVTHLGSAGGIDYYYATTTDVSLAPLIEDMSGGEDKSWDSDNKKLMEMIEFCSYENLGNLKNSFRGDNK